MKRLPFERLMQFSRDAHSVKKAHKDVASTAEVCDGSESAICTTCEGRGRAHYAGVAGPITEPCPDCDGTCRVPHEWSPFA